MGIFRWRAERKAQADAHLIEVMVTALSQALSATLTAQSTQVQQTSTFLGQMQDLSIKTAMRAAGQRGGLKTQERKRAKKAAAPSERQCVLCVNPMHRGTTLEQIEFHRQHENPEIEAPREQGN
jgi:hypothetical protein